MKAVKRKEKNWGEKKKRKRSRPGVLCDTWRGVRRYIGIGVRCPRELHRIAELVYPHPCQTLTAIQIFNDRTRSSRARTL